MEQEEESGVKRPNYGFEPLPGPPPEEAVVDTPEMIQLKEEINRMVCRYPDLIPRTSHALMERLNKLSVEELRNVKLNAVNDVADKRGTPAAETVLLLTIPIDKKLPGYSAICMKDVELKRDIEGELIAVFGWLGARINIIFRLINNGYIAYRDLEKQVEQWPAPPDETAARRDDTYPHIVPIMRAGAEEAPETPLPVQNPLPGASWQ